MTLCFVGEGLAVDMIRKYNTEGLKLEWFMTKSHLVCIIDLFELFIASIPMRALRVVNQDDERMHGR